MTAITDYFLIPLGVLLGARPQEIGFLVAIPNLLGALAQLLAVRIVRLLGSRLNFLVGGVFAQTAILIPIAALSFFPTSNKVAVLIFLVAGFKMIANLIGTVWGSLVSDYLKPEERGRYFGWRTRIAGIAGLSGLFFGGLVLSALKPVSPAMGFSLLFATAAFARFASGCLMAKMENVPIQRKAGADFTLIRFLAQFKKSNFVKFVLYVSSITFATALAGPYFSVYMLRDLDLNYFAYMAIHLASVIGGLISFTIWGRHADVVGNAKILKTTSILIPAIPILWMITKEVPFLFCIEIFSGFVWGGFNLCSVNFIYDAVSREKRVRCLGYFNLINGTALFVGATIGGFLAEHLPPLSGSSILSVFLISAIFRVMSHFLLSHRFQEVRKPVKKISSVELFFSVVGIRPLLGRDQEIEAFPLIGKPPFAGR